MLRPTESPIVFVQQLGRGLRKANQKEFVVILDFIGNYTNNFMIPMALSGDKSYNKDTLRRYVEEGNRVIPGCSTIYFDKIAKERIYKSIDTANFTNAKIIKEAYPNWRFMKENTPKGKQLLVKIDNSLVNLREEDNQPTENLSDSPKNGLINQ